MKNTIIVHGKPGKEEYYSSEYPSSSNFAWIPWLQKQLIIKDIKADTPEMPHAYAPDYAIWKREFERFDITSETVLVGHSCGGGFLVRWLSENKDAEVYKVILVAPSIDPTKKISTGMYDFEYDPELVKRTKGFIIFTSDNDTVNAETSLKIITDAVANIEVKMFSGYGHFIPAHMHTEVFPELLEEILK
ncbi:alpha/beta hydrolase [Candidatus Pacebacteria bacterium]|nr:alpha/beta hydrolase [Candidatus Paceibacterota bacterium]